MSVDITHFFGIGIKLSDNPDFDKYDEIIDKYPQYSRYSFIRHSSEIKSNVRLIVDGMNGDYAYLMYVINEVEQEDMYDSSATREFPFNTLDASYIISQLQEAYPLFTNEELRIQDLKMISLFHVS